MEGWGDLGSQEALAQMAKRAASEDRPANQLCLKTISTPLKLGKKWVSVNMPKWV